MRWTESCRACGHGRPVAMRDVAQGRLYLHCQVCADRAGGGDRADGLRSALGPDETFAVEPTPVAAVRALAGDAPPDGARPDEARPDEARPDEARPDEARPDWARGLPRPGVARGGDHRAPERVATPDGATVAVAPSDVLLVVTEPSADGRIPETLLRALGGAASSCLAFGALRNHGGTARVSLRDRPRPEVLGAPVFEAVLDTPGRRVAVYTVRAEAILELPAEGDRTRVRIWARDPQAPADIEVVASRPGA